jgi:5'-deoxynucleotidase YfbR-like HD superfamily hydrolase
VKAISPRTLSSADIEGGPAQEAMQNFVHEMLHDSPAALKIMSLWTEYEEQTTAEARFVKGKVLFPFP